MKKLLLLALLLSSNVFAWSSYDSAQDAWNQRQMLQNQREALDMQRQQMRDQEFNDMYNRTFG